MAWSRELCGRHGMWTLQAKIGQVNILSEASVGVPVCDASDALVGQSAYDFTPASMHWFPSSPTR